MVIVYIESILNYTLYNLLYSTLYNSYSYYTIIIFIFNFYNLQLKHKKNNTLN